MELLTWHLFMVTNALINLLPTIFVIYAEFFYPTQRKTAQTCSVLASYRFYHRQSKEWTGNAGKIANVADATSVIRSDILYFGTLLLHFKYIAGLCMYIF